MIIYNPIKEIKNIVDLDRVSAFTKVSMLMESKGFIENSFLINDFEEDIKILENFIQSNNIEISRKFDPIVVYINVYGIIRYIEWTTKFIIKEDIFRDRLIDSYNLFSKLNRCEKNRGNNKLSKRCSNLLSQFEKYIDNVPLNNDLERFFDTQVGSRCPSIENILTIFKNILMRNLEDTTNNKEILISNLFEDLFNIKKFRPSLRYKYIKCDKCEIAYSSPYNKPCKDKTFNFIA